MGRLMGLNIFSSTAKPSTRFIHGTIVPMDPQEERNLAELRRRRIEKQKSNG
jgi:hypothetical protein